MIGDDLYKRKYGQPLLKCVAVEQAQYIIKELHEGICGYHSGARTMATRILRAGYFWPTIEADCQDYVKKCKPCQKHGILIHQKQEQLHSILSPWPFAKWGMDILGPFSPGKGQVKFLIVAVDYFTKWNYTNQLTAKVANKVILVELHKQLDSAKGRWPEELVEVLWAYRWILNQQQMSSHSA